MSLELNLNKPVIIILNGHSSSAKSSTIEVMQRLSNKAIVHVGIDQVFCSLGPKFFGSKAKEGFEFESAFKGDADTKEKLRTYIHYGPLGFIVIKGIAALALFYYQQGLNVVIDDVIYYDEIMNNYFETFKDTNTFIFKLFCQDETLLEREHYRSNRALGLGVAQREIIDSKPWQYDKIIDASHISPEEITRIILNFVNREKTQAIHNVLNGQKQK